MIAATAGTVSIVGMRSGVTGHWSLKNTALRLTDIRMRMAVAATAFAVVERLRCAWGDR
jgi:hypothetical protein